VADDGVCFLQPGLVEGAVLGHARATDIAQAGAQVLQSCIIERGKGGRAYNLGKPKKRIFLVEQSVLQPFRFSSRIIDAISTGGDNKVQVEMGSYKPNVKCDPGSTPGPPWSSCVVLFSMMRANRRSRIFGSHDQEEVEVGLPFILETSRRNTFTTGK